jgi:hypothetical protein
MPGLIDLPKMLGLLENLESYLSDHLENCHDTACAEYQLHEDVVRGVIELQDALQDPSAPEGPVYVTCPNGHEVRPDSAYVYVAEAFEGHAHYDVRLVGERLVAYTDSRHLDWQDKTQLDLRCGHIDCEAVITAPFDWSSGKPPDDDPK